MQIGKIEDTNSVVVREVVVDGFTGTDKFTIIGHNHVDDFQVFVISGMKILIRVK